jgi:DNA primase
MVDKDKLQSFIESNRLEHKQNGNSFILNCPDCGHEEKLYIRKSDGLTVCWSCAGENKKPTDRPEFVLSRILGVSVGSVMHSLYGELSFDVSKNGPKLDIKLNNPMDEEEEVSPIEELPVVDIPDFFVKLGHPVFSRAKSYLAGRGITEDIIKEYQIMFNPKTDRIIFPLIIGGMIRGWQDRYIGNKEFWVDKEGKQRKMPKSLTKLDRSKALLFQEHLIGSKHAILCEGPIDAIKAHLCGGAVASMGKQVSNQQLKIIMAYRPEKIYLAFDPDAYEKTMNVVKTFTDNGFDDLYLLYPVDGKKDLGDCTYEEVLKQFNTAPKINSSHLLFYFKT